MENRGLGPRQSQYAGPRNGAADSTTNNHSDSSNNDSNDRNKQQHKASTDSLKPEKNFCAFLHLDLGLVSGSVFKDAGPNRKLKGPKGNVSNNNSIN